MESVSHCHSQCHAVRMSSVYNCFRTCHPNNGDAQFKDADKVKIRILCN